LSYFDGEYSSFNVQKARRLLNDLGLDENMRIIDCSKGMLERIHMIMSISREVDYYFFDEPLAAVDSLTRDRLMEIIEKEKKPGSIVLISTHLISDVEQLFTDVIMIKNGEIILYDSVEKLKEESGEGLETLFKERLR
jgi:ABC-2 type transport system ATP-binding protein